MKKIFIITLIFLLSTTAAFAQSAKKPVIRYNLNNKQNQVVNLPKPKPPLKAVPKDVNSFIKRLVIMAKARDVNKMLKYVAPEAKEFHKVYLSMLSVAQYNDLAKVLQTAKPGIGRGAVVISGKVIKNKVQVILRNNTGQWKIYNIQVTK